MGTISILNSVDFITSIKYVWFTLESLLLYFCDDSPCATEVSKCESLEGLACCSRIYCAIIT